MDTELRSWAVDGPIQKSPFAFPRGLRGRIAGWIMSLKNRQDEVVERLGVRPGDRVLEVGYGPGRLIELLAERARSVTGVDPSAVMRDAAGRRNRAAVWDGRVTLVVGTAERTGLPDRGMDRIVSVNNVAIWPDLEAGVRELHRVLAPGGTLLIAWHSGRFLALPPEKLDRIDRVLEAVFGTPPARHQLRKLIAFVVTRPPTPGGRAPR